MDEQKTLIDLVHLADEMGITLNIDRIETSVDERVGCTRYDLKVFVSGTKYANNKEEVDILKMTQEMLNGS